MTVILAIDSYLKYSFTYDSSRNPLTARVAGANDADTFTHANSTYSDTGNYIKTVEDSLKNTVTYDYNETKGTLDKVTNQKGKETSYLYDDVDRLESVSKTADYQIITNSNFAEQKCLKHLIYQYCIA